MRKICVAILLLLSVPAVWADTQDTTVFKAIMSPDNEVPVISAPGNLGFATITIRVTRDTKGLITAATVIFDIDYTVPIATTFTGLHIHNSLPGTSGGVVINTGVTSVAGGNSISVAAGSGHITKVVNYSNADTAGQTGLSYVTGLLEMPENYYVNIHSTVQGSGLMRAPLLRTSWTFRPQMTPAQESPATTVDAEGAATIQVLVNRNNAGTITSGTVVFDVDYRMPGGSIITGLHIHNAALGANGPVVIDSGINNSTRAITTATGRGNVFRIADITSTDSAGLAALTGIMNDPTQFYVNIHSTLFPTGMMRGQLSRDTYAFFGQMTTAEETPAPAATNPASVANTMTIVKVTRDNTGNITNGTVSFNIAYSGFDAPTTFTGLHIHNGAFGVAAGVVINTGLSGTNTVLAATGSGSINRDVIVDSTSTQAAQDALKGVLQNPELYYVNIHSTVNGGGAIRNQLAREVYHYRTLMSPANEVPPVNASTSATGWVTVKIARDPATGTINGGQVTFDVDTVGSGSQTTFTGLHIHTGSATVAGGVVINTGITGTNNVDSPTGSLNITRVVNIVSTDPANVLTMLGTLINNPDLAYINIHTTINGGGLERSQMLPVLNYVPQVAGGGDWISSITITNTSSTSSVNGIVDTFQSSGTAMSTAFVDPNISFLIPPGGSTTINLHNKGTLTPGFVRVYSSSAVSLNASYSFPALSMTAAVTPLTARMVTLPVTIGPNFTNTGIAILNQTDGQLILTLRDNGLGQIIPGGTRTINVTAGQHISAFLTELLPDVTLPAFSGKLTIESLATTGTGQMSSIALQFDGTLSPVTITPIP